MCLIVDNEVAIVGDAMFGVFPGSIMPPFGNDKPEIVNSWRKLLDTGCNVFVPGHGYTINRLLVQKELEKR